MSEYKNIADMTSDELLAFKRYIDSESAKVKDQLMVAKSSGAATGQYLPIPEYANLLSKRSYYAKKSQAIQFLLGKKKKLEKDERYTSNAESLIARLKADNTRLQQSTDISLQRNTELEAQLAAERERNLNNVANADLQLAELQAEPVYVCEECDNERLIELKEALAAAQAETQAMVRRLTALSEEFQTEETWDGKRNDALRYCAGRLREAIGGEGEK